MLKTILFVSWAQAATVAVFPVTATDPNTAMPIAVPVTYATPTCQQTPKFVEDVLQVVDPTDNFDPKNPTTHDCRMSVVTQFATLPPGTYKAAVKVGTDPYSLLSLAFLKTAMQAHACDATPISPATVQINQSFTLRWCADSRQTITSWRVYRNGVLLPTPTIVAGATVNAAGLRLYTLTRSESAAGPVTIEVSAMNATLEGPRHALPSFTVQVPLVVPSAPSRGGISVP